MLLALAVDIEREKSQDLWVDHEFVFPSTIGTANDPSNLLKKFRQSLKVAGLPTIRFHDLRHTAATQMLINGVDILTVSKRLGHSKSSITLDIYGHIIPGVQEKAASIMDEITTPISLETFQTAPKNQINNKIGDSIINKLLLEFG